MPFTRTTGFFFGRSEVLTRLEQIFDSEKYHRRAAVTGLGGIGSVELCDAKSQIWAEETLGNPPSPSNSPKIMPGDIPKETYFG